MATDATGTPTPLGIPKFNTSQDAPSGLGSNAQMDAIDTLLAERIVKPSGIVAGEAVIWNGTTFVRSSVQKLSPSGIDTYSDWVDYILTWGSTGTQPAIGNGTIVSRYAQLGKLVHLAIIIAPGSTTTFGTGDYTFSMPVAAHASRVAHGAGFGVDASPAASYSFISRWNGTNLRLFTSASPNAAVGATSPITWANGDQINLSLTYEAA